ncbi:MAG: insulinase family protein [Alphaproteobacteria bacterium]|nr:MAG: insulinase family protein [Alphaproteobacteria bacterium]
MFAVSLAMAVAVASAGGTPLGAKETRASTFKLRNGLEVVVVPDHRAPVVTHMVWYRVGAADEPPGKSGIAHFLEHLMFKGTDKIPPGEFSKIVARNGGQDNAFTGQDVTAYFQRVAKDRLPLVMEMEADRMVNLKLLEKDVVTERKVILEERRSRVDNDPSSILNEQMHAALYFSHPYGTPVIGWEHEIAQLNRADALAFYKRYYAPNNAVLVVTGDVTPQEAKALAEKTYGKIEPRAERVRDPRPREPRHAAPVRVLLKDPRAGRATVQRYYISPSYTTAEPGEAEALDLLMKIAASGSTSRLYKALVVEQKIAANAGGWYSGEGLDYGRLGVYGIAAAGVDIAKVEKAIDAVLEEIRQKGVTQKELERARKAYIASHIYGSDSQMTLARRYGWALTVGRSVEDVEEWPERLKKVTLDDIKRVAEKYLDVTHSVTGVLEPAPKKQRTADGKS